MGMAIACGSSSVVYAKDANALREALVACRRARVWAAMGVSVGWGNSWERPGTICHRLSVGAGPGLESHGGEFVGIIGDDACMLGVSAYTLGGVVLGTGACWCGVVAENVVQLVNGLELLRWGFCGKA